MRQAFSAGLLAALLCGGAAQAGGRVCTPETYGARRDGVSDDGRALQRALDACAGGGEVRLSPGVYLIGPVELRTRETLNVVAGATLLGTADHDAYADPKGGERKQPLIGGSKLADVAIVGRGVIDGNGASWWAQARVLKAQGIEPPRPRLVQITDVKNLRVAGVTLQNAAMFHLVPTRAENVLIEDVTIRAPADSPNTDGIDPSAARHVLIQRTTIDTGDDHVAIKAGAWDPAQPGEASADITIRDCTFLHGHGLSIGSETVGGVKRVLAERITFDGATTALRIKTPRGRGGEVAQITYRDIDIKNVREAILVTAWYPKIPPEDGAPEPVGATTPNIHDIAFERIHASEGVQALGGVYGLPERPLRAVTFTDVDLAGGKGLVVRQAEVALRRSRMSAATGEGVVPGEGAQLRP